MMISTSLAMFTASPNQRQTNRCKKQVPGLGLRLSAKFAVQHSPQVLSKLSGTCLAYNITILDKVWQHYYTFWVQIGT